LRIDSPRRGDNVESMQRAPERTPLTDLLRHGFIPAQESIVDSYGRAFTYLRVSVTDLCNLRCVYCMPEEGMKWMPRDEILSFEEIVTAFIKYG